MTLFFDNVFNPHNWAVVPFHFWSLVFFVFGCIVGSFLNVCIYRMPLDLSVVSPPSHCPHCKYAIPFYLNIPLLTWLALRGRCKNCGAPISPRYFIVELLTGLTFLNCWLVFGPQSAALALVYCLFLAGLIVATFIDFEHFIIPHEITIGGAVAGFVISFFLPRLHLVHSHRQGMVQSVIGIMAGWCIVFGVRWLGKLLFGKYSLDLDPESRVIFTESAIVLPPKRLSLERFHRRAGWFAFQASEVELIDRCYKNIEVAISESQMILKSPFGCEAFNRSAIPHLKAIFERQLSLRETAEITGVRWKFVQALSGLINSLGEAFFQRQNTKVHAGDWLVFTSTDAWLCRRELWFGDGEIFYRETDAITFLAREIKIQFGSWRDVSVRLTPVELKIGDAKFNPEAVPQMEVVTDRMILPREAMGFGDVLFMAAIGAFTGWQGVLFSLFASSLIGSAAGVSLIAMRRSEWSSKIPYGPYIALAAAIWIFCGKQIASALFHLTGNF
jgi:leader peptidase (prepilin peptidase)/N-methyltransferase